MWFLIPVEVPLAVTDKLHYHACLYGFYLYLLRLSSLEWKPQHPNSFQQVVFAQRTHCVSTPCFNAQKKLSTQVLFLHACRCCHSCSCLSLAFCALKLLIYSSFLPDRLHLICDEGTGAGDKMFPYYAYIKLNFFCIMYVWRWDASWLWRRLSAVFVGERKEEKQLSTVNCNAFDYTRKTLQCSLHFFFFPLIVFKERSLHRLFI